MKKIIAATSISFLLFSSVAFARMSGSGHMMDTGHSQQMMNNQQSNQAGSQQMGNHNNMMGAGQSSQMMNGQQGSQAGSQQMGNHNNMMSAEQSHQMMSDHMMGNQTHKNMSGQMRKSGMTDDKSIKNQQ